MKPKKIILEKQMKGFGVGTISNNYSFAKVSNYYFETP